MYLTDVSMQLVSMLFVLIIVLYFFILVFSFYRREKRRTSTKTMYHLVISTIRLQYSRKIRLPF